MVRSLIRYKVFTELCDQAKDSEEQLLLTVCRGEVVFDLLVGENLAVEFDYCDAESSSASSLFANTMLEQRTNIVIMRHFGISIGMSCSTIQVFSVATIAQFG